MAVSPVVFYRDHVPTTLTTGYTSPSDRQAILTNLIVSNTTALPATVDVWVGGFILLGGTPVPPNGILSLDMSQLIKSESTIKAQSNVANALVIHASGVEVTA